MKISITLDDRDWGKVAGAIEHALGFERRINSTAPTMANARRVANLARIKHLLWDARKVNRVFGGITPEKVAAFNALDPETIKLKREAARDMAADMYGENGNG